MFAVKISKLKVYARIGVYAAENRKPQLLLVTLKFSYKVNKSKNVDHIENLKSYSEVKHFIKKLKLQKCGLLLGASRKSWISGINDSPIEKRLGGSIASVLYCLDQEVDVFRVHDVFETRQAIEVYRKISCLR